MLALVPALALVLGVGFALALADLVVVMEGGRLLQADTPRAVFQRPSTVFVARFMGGHNIIEATSTAGAIRLPATVIPAPNLPDGPIRLAIRTDRMRLDPTLPYGIEGESTAVEYHGMHIRLGLLDPSGTAHSLMLSEPDFAAHPVVPGQTIRAGFSPADIHFLHS